MAITTSEVSIYVDPNISIEDRIYLSEGTQPAAGYDRFGKRKFAPNRFKSKPNFRAATQDEIEILTAIHEDSDFSNTISVKGIPNEILKAGSALGIHAAKSQADLNEIYTTHPDIPYFNRMVNTYISMLAYPDLKFEFPRQFLHQANLETVSVNYDYDLIGFHLDSTVQFEIGKTEVFPNRISLNVGKNCRYLLFLNKSVKEIANMITEKNPAIKLDLLTDVTLVETFLTLFPDYPVVRLTVKPGEAYIAPTDNVIHDGSTLGSEEVDITIISRGYINPFKNAALISLTKKEE